MKKIVFLFSFMLGIISPSTYALHCNVNFNYGVVIDPTHLRIIDHGQTLVQINDDSQLFIKGREVNLSKTQQQLLTQYAIGIRTQIPHIVSIAIESVEQGLTKVNKIIGGLTGENSASHQAIQEKFTDLQQRLRRRFNQSDQNFYIAPQDFDEFDEIIAGDLEQEVQTIVSQSIGTILVAVGEAMNTKHKSDIEQRIVTAADRIESIGDDIALDIKSIPSSHIQQKSERFCHNLKALNKMEEKVQQSIIVLKSYDLIRTTEE
jgi:hypothetical protein